MDKVNSYAKNHPSEFAYESPLLRKKHTGLCKNVMHATGSAIQTAWTAGSMFVGAGVPGYLIGAGFNAIFEVASWAC